MTQKIFDTDNAEDMALLWDILPESCRKITVGNMWDCVWEDSERFSYRSLFKINWHDKTEITRPIQEATEQDLGKLCKFWDYEEVFYFGILYKIEVDGKEKLYRYRGGAFSHCRRLTKQEIEELC